MTEQTRQSPIRYIPAGFEVDRRREAAEEQERRAGTGKRKRAYNPNRHLQMSDFVFASDIKNDKKLRKWKENQGQNRTARPRDLPDLRSRLKSGGISKAGSSQGERRDRYRPRESRSDLSGPSFDKEGMRLRGALFGNLKLIKRDPRVDPLPDRCFRCWKRVSRTHTQATCPIRGDGNEVFCHNCGRRGRTLDTCERCRDGHL